MAGGTPHVCLVYCRHATTPTTPATTTPSARRQRPSVTSQHKCGVSQSPQARMLVERLSHHSVSCNLERPTMRCVASWHPLTARAAGAAGVASEAQGLQCKVLDSIQDNNHSPHNLPQPTSHTLRWSLCSARLAFPTSVGVALLLDNHAQATPSMPLPSTQRCCVTRVKSQQ